MPSRDAATYFEISQNEHECKDSGTPALGNIPVSGSHCDRAIDSSTVEIYPKIAEDRKTSRARDESQLLTHIPLYASGCVGTPLTVSKCFENLK